MLLEYFLAAGPGHAAAAPRRAKIAAFRLRSPVFRIFDVVCICLIDYEQIMKDSHEIS